MDKAWKAMVKLYPKAWIPEFSLCPSQCIISKKGYAVADSSKCSSVKIKGVCLLPLFLKVQLYGAR